MPRPPRVHIDGALYYITSRAREATVLFRTAQDYDTYLEFLQEARRQLGCKVFAFALLPHSVHLVVEPTGATLSAVMHNLNSRYTKYLAKQTGETGHMFRERFKSTVVEKAPSLLWLTRFVHHLPQLTGAAGDGGTYRWSSDVLYRIGSHADSLIDLHREVEEALECLRREQPGVTYDAFLRAVDQAELRRQEVVLQERVVGSPTFLRLVEQRAKEAALSSITATAQHASSIQEPPTSQPVVIAPSHRARKFPSLVTTGSLMVAAASLCVVIFYARNLSAVRQTMRVLAKERSMSSMTSSMLRAMDTSPTPQPASFTFPSRLNDTHWTIEVHSTIATGETIAQQDQIEFNNGKMVSHQLSAQGFTPSNYTLTMQTNGTVVWETMQTNPEGVVVCWRGEWNGQTMRGVLTRQLPGQATASYTFAGVTTSQPNAMKSPTKEI